ncbi:hypothetical protein ACFFWC_18590 [Plantactinospora siamensis]|uniref:Uncharacterized protein n=1 Tax=Plantactinospora siamensis TaxID=555372 RepID=A0ABV6P357_9ACTN
MPTAEPMTYVRLGEILQEIGMVSAATVRRVLADGYLDVPLSQYEAALALEEFGVAVSIHAEDIDSIHTDYRGLLERAAEVAGDRVAIRNVRIVEGAGELEDGRDDRLEFERDGRPVSIPAEHYAEDYYDHAAASQAIAETAHEDDPRAWYDVRFEREPRRIYESIMVLATPQQAAALCDRLGVTFH